MEKGKKSSDPLANGSDRLIWIGKGEKERKNENFRWEKKFLDGQKGRMERRRKKKIQLPIYSRRKTRMKIYFFIFIIWEENQKFPFPPFFFQRFFPLFWLPLLSFLSRWMGNTSWHGYSGAFQKTKNYSKQNVSFALVVLTPSLFRLLP